MKDTFVTNYIEKFKNFQKQNEFQALLQEMASDKGLEKWLEIVLSLQESKELYRDTQNGYVLTAYTENEGKYRVPHDHGHCWVVYAVMSGAVEMGTYELESDSKIFRNANYELRPGDSRIYLRGEIHDTRCVSDKVIILRFTSCDLKLEEKEGRMKRYPHQISL